MTNRLDHEDKGQYSCQAENQVGRTEQTTLLLIEHPPIQSHIHNKVIIIIFFLLLLHHLLYLQVAYAPGVRGSISCRMRAFPEPRFDWTFGDDVLELDVVNYSSNVTTLDADLFESILTVTR